MRRARSAASRPAIRIGTFRSSNRSRFVNASRFQFRAEALKRVSIPPQFRAPNTAVGNSNFGVITQQANFPRYLQLGGRITFLDLRADLKMREVDLAATDSSWLRKMTTRARVLDESWPRGRLLARLM